MPRKALTPCSWGRCPETTRGRYCDEHGEKKWGGDDRPSASERGYDARWQKVRDMYARRNPLCERCEERGETRAVEVVHHIVPIRDGGARYAFDNLESLCRSCHQREHGE